MNCLNPVIAVSPLKIDGKHQLKFLPVEKLESLTDLKRVYGSDNVFVFGCGRCENCRKDYSKHWADRCTVESLSHKFNYFITLTYDDFHLDKASRKDVKKFIRALTYHLYGDLKKIPYFYCQENGELNDRLHYHLILFLDKELNLKNPVKLGSFYHYHASEITAYWSYGLHDITPFEHDCAAYVAKYSTKTGQCFMSRNLGYQYYLDHRDEIIQNDFKIYGSFNLKKFIDVPKFMMRWFVRDFPFDFDDFKAYKAKLGRIFETYAVNNSSSSDVGLMKVESILSELNSCKMKRGRNL